MAVVWVAGCCSYETIGVMYLLKGCGISARLFRLGERLQSGDTLILCFSSAPLLGWWRYLKITQWVMDRYDIRLIVLCPDDVYQTGIIHGRNMQTVNGKRGGGHLSWLLQQAVQCCLLDGIPRYHLDCIKLPFLEKAVQALRILPARESDCQAARRAYYLRDQMVQRLGFASLMKLKVFMSGFVW